jgi:hypothetical protein
MELIKAVALRGRFDHLFVRVAGLQMEPITPAGLCACFDTASRKLTMHNREHTVLSRPYQG